MTPRLPTHRTVSQNKLRGYLLNRAHQDGGPKAAFFLAFGRNPCIRTIWMDEGKGSAALVTAYPAE